MRTVTYKGRDWPVTEGWAERFLAGWFHEIVSWTTKAQWDRLWEILRKSDETFAERTAGLTHDEVKALMLDPEVRREIIETLSSDEFRELRAVEAHIILRNVVDHLLGRELEEFDIHFIDHAHGQGCVSECGCELLFVKDDDKLARTHAGESGLKFMHAHFPKNLCPEHSHLHAVVAGSGRWHNQPLAVRLEFVKDSVLHGPKEAQPDAAVA